MCGSSELKPMVLVAGEILPEKRTVRQQQIPARRILLGQRYGAGIEIEVSLSEFLPAGDMGVAVEKNVPLLQRRKRCSMIEMPMGDKEAAAARKAS